MSPDAFLGRALLDPTTGLPNVPYFRLIREWEERRAQRRKYSVREVTMRVSGGAVRVRRALSWRLCRELRESDLIASGGPGEFHILLTSPDAEYAERVSARIQAMASEINHRHPDEPPLDVEVEVSPATGIATEAEREPATDAAPPVPPARSAYDRVTTERVTADRVTTDRMTTDREVEVRAAVEPGVFRERRRFPRISSAPIVPQRSCQPNDGTTAA